MRIDLVPFCANLFLYTHESEYMSELISNDKVKKRHFDILTQRFIDDLGTLNDESVFNDVCKDIYPPELQLKADTFLYPCHFVRLKYYCKRWSVRLQTFYNRDAFPFFVVHMPYTDSNIPKSIFYPALFGEFLRIAHSSILYKDFNEKAIKLLNRKKAQGARSVRCRKA